MDRSTILGNFQSIVIHNAETKLRIEIAFPGLPMATHH